MPMSDKDLSRKLPNGNRRHHDQASRSAAEAPCGSALEDQGTDAHPFRQCAVLLHIRIRCVAVQEPDFVCDIELAGALLRSLPMTHSPVNDRGSRETA